MQFSIRGIENHGRSRSTENRFKILFAPTIRHPGGDNLPANVRISIQHRLEEGLINSCDTTRVANYPWFRKSCQLLRKPTLRKHALIQRTLVNPRVDIVNAV